MNKIVNFPQNLSPGDAKRLVRQFYERDSRNLKLTNHARERMKERSITTRQIVNCLKRGVVCEQPFFNARHGTFKFDMRATCAGEDILIAVAIDTVSKILIITVHGA